MPPSRSPGSPRSYSGPSAPRAATVPQGTGRPPSSSLYPSFFSLSFLSFLSLLPLFFLTAFGLAGCASAPEPSRPELGVDVPEAWTSKEAEEAMETEPPPLPSDRWWRGFGDPRLNELVAEALERNHDLAAAAARVEQAAAQARIAGADVLPQASAGASGSRRRQNFIGFPIPGGEEQVLSTTSTTVGLSLDLSWEVDLWGRLRSQESAARADYEARRAEWSAARLSLAGQVAKSWFALLETRAQAGLARATAENRRLTEERIRRRYEAGLRSPLELRLAMTQRAGAEALLAQRRRQLDAIRRQLEILAGRYPRGTLGPEGTPAAEPASTESTQAGTTTLAASLPIVPPVPAAGVPSELLSRRPDLAAAEGRLAAAGARVEAARAALYPRLSFSGSLGRTAREIEDLPDPDFSVWSLLGNALQPVFQGGRLEAGVELARSRAEEAGEAWIQTALRAFSEVETALAAEDHLDRQARALEEAAGQALASRRLAEEQYAAGLMDLLTVLESQRQALDAQSRLLTALRQRLDNRVDLHLALGGGFRGGGSDAATPRGAGSFHPSQPPKTKPRTLSRDTDR